MKKGIVFLLSILSLLAGIVIGILCTPAKGRNHHGTQRYFENDEDVEDFYGC